MIIIEMILRITGWSQEELARQLGVSRVSVNCWLHGNDISTTTRKLISNRFKFPVTFFDATLDENIEYYKLIYSVLYTNLKREISNNSELSDQQKIKDIINRIEIDDKSKYHKEISDDDIFDGLLNGYDPFTGEIFNESHILLNPKVKKILNRIKPYMKSRNITYKYEDLDNTQKQLFQKLKIWRLSKTQQEGFFGAFQVFSDQTLINIIKSNIKNKEELLRVKGIGPDKYRKYSDELFELINSED